MSAIFSWAERIVQGASCCFHGCTCDQVTEVDEYGHPINLYNPANIFHLVIPSPDGGSLLVEFDGQALCVPKVVPPRDEETPWVNSWRRETDDLCTVVSERLNSPVYIRRLLWKSPRYPPALEVMVVVDVMDEDYLPSRIEPDGMKWVSREEALTAKWCEVHPECKLMDILTTFFRENLGESKPSIRARWRERDWFRETVIWFKDVLSKHGLEPQSEVIQMRNSFHSTLLKCRVTPSYSAEPGTRSQDVYLKESISLIPEAAVTSTVSLLLPHITAKVLATTSVSFVQLKAFDNCTGYPDSFLLMDVMGKMQLESLGYLDQLKLAGIPDRSLTWLRDNIESILNHDVLRRFDKNIHMLELRSRVGDIKELCNLLLSFEIPHTLVHGDLDLYTGNVMYDEDADPPSMKFIDWGCCCIAFPFYDYARASRVGWDSVKDPAARDCYLNQWLRFATREEIVYAAAASNPLMKLNILFGHSEVCAATEAVEQYVILDLFEYSGDLGLEAIVSDLNEALSRVAPALEARRGTGKDKPRA